LLNIGFDVCLYKAKKFSPRSHFDNVVILQTMSQLYDGKQFLRQM